MAAQAITVAAVAVSVALAGRLLARSGRWCPVLLVVPDDGAPPGDDREGAVIPAGSIASLRIVCHRPQGINDLRLWQLFVSFKCGREAVLVYQAMYGRRAAVNRLGRRLADRWAVPLVEQE